MSLRHSKVMVSVPSKIELATDLGWRTGLLKSTTAWVNGNRCFAKKHEVAHTHVTLAASCATYFFLSFASECSPGSGLCCVGSGDLPPSFLPLPQGWFDMLHSSTYIILARHLQYGGLLDDTTMPTHLASESSRALVSEELEAKRRRILKVRLLSFIAIALGLGWGHRRRLFERGVLFLALYAVENLVRLPSFHTVLNSAALAYDFGDVTAVTSISISSVFRPKVSTPITVRGGLCTPNTSS